MRKPSAAQISAVMRAMGSKGGSVCGPQKARTSEQARAASRVRWDKARAARHEADEDACMVSNCCGSKAHTDGMQDAGICAECGDHCEYVREGSEER